MSEEAHIWNHDQKKQIDLKTHSFYQKNYLISLKINRFNALKCIAFVWSCQYYA
jgi:hypothetical protein